MGRAAAPTISRVDLEHIVGGALVQDGKVFLCHRSPSRSRSPNLWDLPGGHIEPGESPEAALKRELSEELGVDVELTPGVKPYAVIAEEGFDLAIYALHAWSGSLVNRAPAEHDEVGWFGPADLPDLALAHHRYAELLSGLVVA
jgi:8-oxo-dGTP pyrophosphatase MutT (NUDIX family)